MYSKYFPSSALVKNQLTSLPAELGGLTGLRELHLSGNGLASLPGEIGKLSNLEGLHLGDNALQS